MESRTLTSLRLRDVFAAARGRIRRKRKLDSASTPAATHKQRFWRSFNCSACHENRLLPQNRFWRCVSDTVAGHARPIQQAAAARADAGRALVSATRLWWPASNFSSRLFTPAAAHAAAAPPPRAAPRLRVRAAGEHVPGRHAADARALRADAVRAPHARQRRARRRARRVARACCSRCAATGGGAATLATCEYRLAAGGGDRFLPGRKFGVVDQIVQKLLPDGVEASPLHFRMRWTWRCAAGCGYGYVASASSLQLPLLLSLGDVAALLAAGVLARSAPSPPRTSAPQTPPATRRARAAPPARSKRAPPSPNFRICSSSSSTAAPRWRRRCRGASPSRRRCSSKWRRPQGRRQRAGAADAARAVPGGGCGVQRRVALVGRSAPRCGRAVSRELPVRRARGRRGAAVRGEELTLTSDPRHISLVLYRRQLE